MPVELAHGQARPDRELTAVTVGRWARGAVVDAHVRPVEALPSTFTLRAPPTVPSAELLSPEDASAVLGTAAEHSGGLSLGSGGSMAVLFLQVLHITQDFADWYSAFTAVRLDVAASIVPIELVPDDWPHDDGPR